MEAMKGRLVPFCIGKESIERTYFLLCERHNLEVDEDNDYREAVMDAFPDDYLEIGDTLYKMKAEELDPCGFTEVEIDNNGTIDFIALWYNGGGSLGEVLEAAVKREQAKGDKHD